MRFLSRSRDIASAAAHMFLRLGLVCALTVGCRERLPTALPAKSPVADSAAETAPPQFVDATQASGVLSIYRNGEEAGHRSIVESLGGGVGVADYDRDGLPDLFFPGGGSLTAGEPLAGLPGSLWRNLGRLQFANVAGPATIESAPCYSHGVASADFDSDGFADVLVTGYGGLQLFCNRGDGTFVESGLAAGLVDERWSSSAAWGDFDGDGNVDLYVVHYVNWSWQNHPYCPASVPDRRETCSPLDFQPLPDLLYWNQGDGTFRPDTAATAVAEPGKGLGVIAVDVNADQLLDLYVANDTTANFLFLNRGDRRFEEAGVASGTAYDQRGLPNGSMGVATLDYNRDLVPDLWVTNYENETFALYHNDGQGLFRCLTESAGIAALGTLYVGFGTVAGDFTNTGLEDLVVTNGHVMQHPRYSTVAQEPLYLRNSGRGKFARLKFPAGHYFATAHRGRGVVASDLDLDGQLDLVFSHVNEPATILRQQSKPQGSWVSLVLVGRSTNRDGIGARVVLETSQGSQLRQVVGGGSYLSQNPYEVRFGLPKEARCERAIITWPSGIEQIVQPAAGQVQTVIEPRAR
jgi:enediyne biosynthesis protein E4